MKRAELIFAILISVTGMAITVPVEAQPPLRVLSSNGVKAVIERVQNDIERSIGQKLSIEFSTATQLASDIEAGQTFDVTILTPALIETLIEADLVDADSYVEFARAGVGVGSSPRHDACPHGTPVSRGSCSQKPPRRRAHPAEESRT